MGVFAAIDAGGVVEGVSGGYGLLVGGGAFALLGVMLTVREARQKRYDERADRDMDDMRADNAALRQRVDALQAAALRRDDEIGRLRELVRKHGGDPGPWEVTT